MKRVPLSFACAASDREVDRVETCSQVTIRQHRVSSTQNGDDAGITVPVDENVQGFGRYTAGVTSVAALGSRQNKFTATPDD